MPMLRGGPVHAFDADAVRAALLRRRLASLPGDPIEFLQDCAAWWAWLAEAHPGDIEREPVMGHRAPVEPGPAYWAEKGRLPLLGEAGAEALIPGSAAPGLGVIRPSARFTAEAGEQGTWLGHFGQGLDTWA